MRTVKLLKHWLTQPQIDYIFRHPVAVFEVQ